MAITAVQDKRALIHLCHFCSYIAVETKARFVLECPRYNFIRDKFQLLFKNVVLKSLTSFMQLDHQADISLYLTEANAVFQSKKLTSLTSS